jgi:alkanesulfonate monooxygenase SsuD/methylene tetrahydromethanopterin reductase-like flavin-dependent oxidoreductase (luciferase family)
VTGLDGQPKPVQRPSPPFLLGGGAPKILALAAREAQIVGINANLRSGDGHSQDAAHSLVPAATDQKLAWLREAAGARFDELEIQSLIGFVHVTEDARSIAEAIAKGFGVSAEEALLAPATLVGSHDGISDLLEQRRERWQMSYVVIPHEAVETFAPIVARLDGK